MVLRVLRCAPWSNLANNDFFFFYFGGDDFSMLLLRVNDSLGGGKVCARLCHLCVDFGC